MKGNAMFMQAYNAQAVVNEQQIVLAAEISTEPIDFSSLGPMMTATRRELEQAGIDATPELAVADAGYWNERHMDQLAADGITVLIRPDSGKRNGERPGWIGGRYSWMRRLLATNVSGELYRKRRHSLEPVFGHTKHNRQFTHFHRRGPHRRAHRVAITDGDAQPGKAPHSPDRHRGALNGPRGNPEGHSATTQRMSARAARRPRLGRALRDGLPRRQSSAQGGPG